MWRAAEAALLAETLERAMETKPDEPKVNPGACAAGIGSM
jgi:hypothetical protein